MNNYEKLSLIDPLTNIYNRRHITINIERLISKNKKDNNPFCAILIDLDYFKQINDFYGHLKGDIVLKGVANSLKSNTRDCDIIGRWGGEEFLILCTNTNSFDTENIAEKLRIEIEKLSFENCIKTTASFGVAEFNFYLDKNQERFLNRVDNALYIAKSTGRNRVEVI